MKYIDKTPYRSESGEISLINRVQGTLKYGLSWYDRVKAQDEIAAILERQLSGQFVLLQNVSLPNTDIDLPLILIGPPGIYLINALHERGVYMARDDEWGTLSGETFSPADINQVKRAMTMAKVLSTYLDRLGLKNLSIEPVILAGNPGLHIDSTRPHVRIIMFDAIDRFALSIMQASPVFNPQQIAGLERVILTGQGPRAAAPAKTQEEASTTGDSGEGVFLPEEDGSGELAFNFDDEAEAAAFSSEQASFDAVEASGQPRPQKAKKPKKKKIMGMTPVQLGIVIALLLCWLCGLLSFAVYYFYSIGWIQFA